MCILLSRCFSIKNVIVNVIIVILQCFHSENVSNDVFFFVHRLTPEKC